MITVFGSINIDQVYQVQDFPKPGETIIGKGYLEVPGGKGANQAVAARRSGAVVRMIGCVESSGMPNSALKYLISDDVNLDALQKVESPTGSASIWVSDQGENSIIVNPGANALIKAELVADESIANSAYLLMQMEVPVEENLKLIERAKSLAVQTVLNLAPVGKVPESILKSLDYLVVNEGEAEALAQMIGMEFSDHRQFLMQLSARFNLNTILTLGADGVIASYNNEVFELPAKQIKVRDTTAAGDSFIGALFAELSFGTSFLEALAYAVNFASETCSRNGAQSSIPYKFDILSSENFS
ncbi:ribokinase [Sneathiella limimaris]|uniref:ribokinase n=1 Tax=Sneathiella limimaris TaxID=1964213 RepID=UPI00146D103B|nr:ribokinase [Sneathiella limimaris]